MLEMCRQYYRGHRKQLKLIDEFERGYRPEDAIRWYSKQSFVYQLINKTLRSEDIDQLHIFRFFIGDLSESLAREHQQMDLSGEKTLIVYCGTKLSNIELEQFKAKKGQLISTDGFLSTSCYRSRALAFAQKRPKRSDTIPILFEINCDIQQLRNSVIFADIQKLSEYPEEEILFDLSATFQINHVEHDGIIWTIQMSASSEGRTIVQDYIKVTRHETVDWSVGIMFGRLMCHIDQYEKSQRYFEQLLIDPNGEGLASIEMNIGRVLHFKGEWKDARKYYDRVYEQMMNDDPPRVKDSAFVLNNIGDLLRNEGNYDEAIDFYQRALVIQEQYYPPGHPNISVTISNIGRLVRKSEKVR